MAWGGFGSRVGLRWVTALGRAVWSSPHGELAVGAWASQRRSALSVAVWPKFAGNGAGERRFGD